MNAFWTTLTVAGGIIVMAAIAISSSRFMQAVDAAHPGPKPPGRAGWTAWLVVGISWVAFVLVAVIAGPGGDLASALGLLAIASVLVALLVRRAENRQLGFTESPGAAAGIGCFLALVAFGLPIQIAEWMLAGQEIPAKSVTFSWGVSLGVGGTLAVLTLVRWTRRSVRIRRTQSHRFPVLAG